MDPNISDLVLFNLDLDGSFDLAKDRFEGGFSLKDGALVLNDLPGLGVFEISEEDDI